jgi:hypothetical protein
VTTVGDSAARAHDCFWVLIAVDLDGALITTASSTSANVTEGAITGEL